jgi:hypothetical protein
VWFERAAHGGTPAVRRAVLNVVSAPDTSAALRDLAARLPAAG